VRASPISFEAVERAVIVHGHVLIERDDRTQKEARHWVFRFRPGRFRTQKLASVEAFPDRASALNDVVEEDS
jgi:hypothetical protein